MEREVNKGNHSKKRKYESSTGLRIVCFLIPLVGLIVYAVNIVQRPKIAKECGLYALIGFIIGIVIIGICWVCILLSNIRDSTGIITTVTSEEQIEYQDEQYEEAEKLINDILADY